LARNGWVKRGLLEANLECDFLTFSLHSCFQLGDELGENCVCQFGWVDVVHTFDSYASFLGDVEEVLPCLGWEGCVGYFFWVVVPVPDFESVAGGVCDDGFLFQRGVVSY